MLWGRPKGRVLPGCSSCVASDIVPGSGRETCTCVEGDRGVCGRLLRQQCAARGGLRVGERVECTVVAGRPRGVMEQLCGLWRTWGAAVRSVLCVEVAASSVAHAGSTVPLVAHQARPVARVAVAA